MDGPGLRGREADVTRLARALAPPHPRVVVLLAPEGCGSSTVVDAALKRGLPFWAWSRGATAWGSGAAVLLGLLTEAQTTGGDLPDPTAAVQAVTAALQRGELTSTRFPYSTAAAVLELVEQVCARGPALAVLEDLHRAEPAVLALVRFLLRRLPGLDLSLLLTARPDVAREPLARTLRTAAEAGAAVLELPPLGDDVVLQVAEDALGAPPPPALAAQLRQCGGDLELAHALLADAVDPDGGHAPAVAAARLADLSPDAARLVRTAAVVGPRCPTDVLADVVGLPAFSLEPLLSEALGQRLLREEGDALVFRSGLVREAASAAVPPVLRRRLHRECARSLERCGAPPEQVAEQLRQGGALAEHGPQPGAAAVLDGASPDGSSLPGAPDGVAQNGSSPLQGPVSEDASGAPWEDPLRGLPPAQQRVARLAAQGMSNAEIAAALFLSPYTVGTHLKQVYARLGLHSRAQLAALVARSRLPG